MKVIIPAAGLGSRLRPHTFTIPKPLIPIAGKPILGHILDQVISWGGDHITIIVNHLHEQIEKYVRREYDIFVEFKIQEQMLGLGHAIMTGMDPEDKEVLIILGDTIIDTDMTPVIQKKITSIGVKEVEDPRKFGVVMLENGKVKRLIEKPQNPPTNLAIVGVYYIRDGGMLIKAVQEIMKKGITVKNEYQVTDALQMMIDWGETVETFPVTGWYDCGKPETLIETNRYLFDRIGSTIQDISTVDVSIIEPVHIENDVQIERAIIGPYVSIGRGSVIKDSIISDSLIGYSCQIENMVLHDTLMGNKAHLIGQKSRYNIGDSSRIG